MSQHFKEHLPILKRALSYAESYEEVNTTFGDGLLITESEREVMAPKIISCFFEIDTYPESKEKIFAFAVTNMYVEKLEENLAVFIDYDR